MKKQRWQQRTESNGVPSCWRYWSFYPSGKLAQHILQVNFKIVTQQVRVTDRPSHPMKLVKAIAMVADDSKCYKIIGKESDLVNLQQDLNALFASSLCIEMYFLPAKCKNVSISRERVSVQSNYSLNGIDLEVVKSEKDLGVMLVLLMSPLGRST